MANGRAWVLSMQIPLFPIGWQAEGVRWVGVSLAVCRGGRPEIGVVDGHFWRGFLPWWFPTVCFERF
jgi:hypothetical protein